MQASECKLLNVLTNSVAKHEVGGFCVHWRITHPCGQECLRKWAQKTRAVWRRLGKQQPHWSKSWKQICKTQFQPLNYCKTVDGEWQCFAGWCSFWWPILVRNLWESSSLKMSYRSKVNSKKPFMLITRSMNCRSRRNGTSILNRWHQILTCRCKICRKWHPDEVTFSQPSTEPMWIVASILCFCKIQLHPLWSVTSFDMFRHHFLQILLKQVVMWAF